MVELTAHPAEKGHTHGMATCWSCANAELARTLMVDLRAVSKWSDGDGCMEHYNVLVSKSEIINGIANLGRESKEARLLLILRPSV